MRWAAPRQGAGSDQAAGFQRNVAFAPDDHVIVNRDAKQAAFEGRRQAILRRTDNNTPARLRVGAHGPASAELPL